MITTIDPANLQPHEFYRYVIGSIAPRPIAFASTVDSAGKVNLSPFSLFNVFSYNPHLLVFSPILNHHGQPKDTLLNMQEVSEVVINVVNYAMVEQMSLTSAEFDRGVNEFDKSGFTALPSERVRPPRVAESPAAYECVVRQLISTGDKPGAGTLVVCEVLVAHFHDTIFDDKGAIDPHKIDLIGRMGGDWYCRTSGDAAFEVARPKIGIGVDKIPHSIRNSVILTGNDLGKLGSFPTFPSAEDVTEFRESGVLNEVFDEARYGCQYLPDLLHTRAKQYLAENRVREAWLTLLQRI